MSSDLHLCSVGGSCLIVDKPRLSSEHFGNGVACDSIDYSIVIVIVWILLLSAVSRVSSSVPPNLSTPEVSCVMSISSSPLWIYERDTHFGYRVGVSYSSSESSWLKIMTGVPYCASCSRGVIGIILKVKSLPLTRFDTYWKGELESERESPRTRLRL